MTFHFKEQDGHQLEQYKRALNDNAQLRLQDLSFNMDENFWDVLKQDRSSG